MATLHATARRRKTQKGQEIIEFALAGVLFVPILIGAFVVGMNLIRSIQTNQVCRDLADMYIHGGDFSTYPLQQEAQRLAQGLNLQIGASFSGNEQSNTGNGGNGLVTVTQVMWVGSTSSASCVAVGPSNCTNHDSFVYTQQIQFGNGTLANSNTQTVGACPAAIMNSSGIVQNYITDSRAALPGSAQTNMQSLWQSGNSNQTALTDQQVVYIAETYFQSPDLTVGSL
ncbi:MAG: hypothetical protein JOZ32_15730, partial [Bryobacterales bacterium]|nr:hypothetical protein [Bryobacterales bacterium]